MKEEIENLPGEVWKAHPKYEGLYEDSNFGRVKSLNYYGHKGWVHLMGLHEDAKGYQQVYLMKDGEGEWKKVHHMVWETFVGEIPKGLQINHKDEVKNNNCLDNLEICTPKYNNNYGTRIERAKKALSKPVMQYTKDGEFVMEWPSTREIERQAGYLCSGISLCCNGKRKYSYGYIWKYKDGVG